MVRERVGEGDGRAEAGGRGIRGNTGIHELLQAKGLVGECLHGLGGGGPAVNTGESFVRTQEKV